MRTWLALALLFAANIAHAQGVSSTIEATIAAQKPKAEAILLQQQRSLNDGCTKLQVLAPVAVSMWNDNRWNVRYAVNACDMAQLRNIYMHKESTGLALEAMAPGDSLTDPQLQADVIKSFSMAGRVAMPKCTQKTAVIRDVRVRIIPKTPQDPWQELWIGRMCERDLGQAVEFLPTKNGTTFKMALPKK